MHRDSRYRDTTPGLGAGRHRALGVGAAPGAARAGGSVPRRDRVPDRVGARKGAIGAAEA